MQNKTNVIQLRNNKSQLDQMIFSLEMKYIKCQVDELRMLAPLVLDCLPDFRNTLVLYYPCIAI